MSEYSILRARLLSCERRLVYSGLFTGVGVSFLLMGKLIPSFSVEFMGITSILCSLGILVYSMYRSLVDY